jgi:hypothetical protein
MKKEMNVSIDHSRHERAVAQVDYLCAGRMRYRTSSFDDALSFDQKLSRLNDPSGFDVEKTSSVQHNGMCPSLGRRLRKAASETKNGDAGEKGRSTQHANNSFRANGEPQS